MRYKIKESRYIQAIFRYGIVPVLLLLDELEQDMEFEECKVIINAINYCNEHLSETEDYEPLPTKYNSESLSSLKKRFSLFGLKGDIAEANISYYINEIKELVEL